MDTEKMKQDLGGGNVFEVGEPNTAFAQYFIGQSLSEDAHYRESGDRQCDF